MYLSLNVSELPQALSLAHTALYQRTKKEGRTLNKKEQWLRKHKNDLDPYSSTSNSQHDGPGHKPRIDYRPWKKRKHIRTYWPGKIQKRRRACIAYMESTCS